MSYGLCYLTGHFACFKLSVSVIFFSSPFCVWTDFVSVCSCTASPVQCSISRFQRGNDRSVYDTIMARFKQPTAKIIVSRRLSGKKDGVFGEIHILFFLDTNVCFCAYIFSLCAFARDVNVQ